MAKSFRTHTGEIVTGERLQAAINQVADDWEQLSRDIYNKNTYAAHVTEAQKQENLTKGLAFADSLRNGANFGFTIWQRVNTKLTGECVAFLP